MLRFTSVYATIVVSPSFESQLIPEVLIFLNFPAIYPIICFHKIDCRRANNSQRCSYQETHKRVCVHAVDTFPNYYKNKMKLVCLTGEQRRTVFKDRLQFSHAIKLFAADLPSRDYSYHDCSKSRRFHRTPYHIMTCHNFCDQAETERRCRVKLPQQM